jgi:hypothetical protein
MSRPAKQTRLKSRDPGSFKALLIRMNLEGWRSLRILAAETDATLNALAIEALNDLLKKHGKKQTVENPLVIKLRPSRVAGCSLGRRSVSPCCAEA